MSSFWTGGAAVPWEKGEAERTSLLTGRKRALVESNYGHERE